MRETDYRLKLSFIDFFYLELTMYICFSKFCFKSNKRSLKSGLWTFQKECQIAQKADKNQSMLRSDIPVFNVQVFTENKKMRN